MVVGGKDVFTAKSWVDEHRRLEFKHPINVPLRTLVLIQMPVIDLRLVCLLKVAYRLNNKEDALTLEIPTTLQKEIFDIIVKKKHGEAMMLPEP